MSIWGRLGSVINSYINDIPNNSGIKRNSPGNRYSGDPDLDAAFDELNDYLKGKESSGSDKEQSDNTQSGKTWDTDDKFKKAWEGKFRGENYQGSGKRQNSGPPPENLRADFAELGVSFGASAEECKAAYKNLLKKHHPDRHASHDGNFKKATDKAARINAAWDRIQKFYNNS